jgi:hypothetical protein
MVEWNGQESGQKKGQFIRIMGFWIPEAGPPMAAAVRAELGAEASPRKRPWELPQGLSRSAKHKRTTANSGIRAPKPA